MCNCAKIWNELIIEIISAKNEKYHKEAGYADVCGKCLVGLPCSLKEPALYI
jgi:hypothetical protein